MIEFPENIESSKLERYIISEIENRTELILKETEFNLELEVQKDRVYGKVYLFEEYHDNFWVLLPNRNVFEKICTCIFLLLTENGNLKDTIVNSKRWNLEGKLESTTNKLLEIIKSKQEVEEHFGKIIIMVEEKFPYNEFYENRFPVWQYEIRDSLQKINIFEVLDYDLENFNETQLLKKVDKAIQEIFKTQIGTGHNKRR